MQHKMSYDREQPATRPKTRPVVKPTFDVRRRLVSSPGPDPNDLSRRLFKVLADQKAREETGRHNHTNAEPRARASASSRSEASSEQREPDVRASRSSAPMLQFAEARQKKDDGESSSTRSQSKSSHTEISRSKSMSKAEQKLAKRKSSKRDADAAKAKPSEPYHHIPRTAAAQFVQTAARDVATERTNTQKLSGPTKVPEPEPSYRHIPRVAAAQFVQTAARDGVAERKPSKKQNGRPNSDESVSRSALAVHDHNVPTTQRSKSIRKAKSHKEITVQPRSLLTPDGLTLQQRHTFDPTMPRRTESKRQASRRMSTGDLLTLQDPRRSSGMLNTEDEASSPIEKPKTLQEIHEISKDHRIDWSQNDESRPRTRGGIVPLLRKADSIWTLRGRLGSFGKHAKEDKAILDPEDSGASKTDEAPKSPKAGFFSRFKR